ncbi:early nodulin-like protein 8 [Tasmannia lanceolata]|uniref:early nodulin-like protein 8 n=1 Tax=Tasmannia lanceolata TaxID=3420 RepID=UPI0040638C15
MASPFPKYQILCALHFLVFLQTKVLCYQYKVGDLDDWGVPTSANPLIYTNWSQKHQFTIGDSLLFLYPPSQDSLVQVTEQAFNSCNISNPILYMDDGNSVFNLTSPGKFYFTSGASGHCQNSQKLEISVGSTNGSAFSPSDSSTMLPAMSPSFSNVFGSIPTSSSTSKFIPVSNLGAIGSAILILFSCI